MDLTSSTFDQYGGAKSPILSDAQKGAFKGANDLGKLPEGGSSSEGVGTLQKKAQGYAFKHSTKGLFGARPSATKTRSNTNIGKAIGRKRGY